MLQRFSMALLMMVMVRMVSSASPPSACADRVTFLAVYPAMPSETNSAKERPKNVRNAPSRALRALETPEEKLVRREIRNEKDRARRRRAKTKQKQVAK